MTLYHRILVIRYGGLGDFLLTLPLLAAIRHFFPHARVTFMGNREYATLAQGSYIDVLEPAERHGISTFFIKDGDLDPDLSAFFASFDLVFSFRTDNDGIFAANIMRANKKEVIVRPPAPDQAGLHTADYLLSSLDEVGVDWRSFSLPIPLLSLAKEGMYEAVAIHPGSGSVGKCWPVQHYIELARRLEQEGKYKPVFIFGPADEDLKRKVGWHFSAYDNRDIQEVAVFLAGCRAFVGNDSGVTHLAASLGVPTIALFGPTDPTVWGPRGKHVRIICGHADCSPCTEEERRGCKNRVCLDSLPVDTVHDALLEMLKRA